MRMGSQEITEWMAFAKLEPFGTEYVDAKFASLMSLVANIVAEKKFTPEDFMPRYESPSPQAIHNKMRLFSALVSS